MLLTYEEVKEICDVNESFKMKHQLFGTTHVAQCTYFLASAGDFFDAKKDGSMIRATELRGITFVKEGEDGEWKRYLFLDKFFNINQTNGTDATLMNLTINGKTTKCNINKLYSFDGDKAFRAIDLKVGQTVGEFNRDTEEVGELFIIETLEKELLPTEIRENSWMYDDVKDLKIVRIGDKEDGSAIRFLRINGELVAKTKFSLEAEQTTMAMTVVNSNKRLKDFILKTLDSGLTALFEIVSPFNKVVLSYNDTSLKLIQIRDDATGEYLDIYNHSLVEEFNVLCAKQEPLHTLDELLEMAQNVQDKEGWVVTFENGKMAKVKTVWYMNLHGILTDGLKEHKLVRKILEEEIDDVLAFIPVENTEERDFINELTEVVVKHVNHIATYCYDSFNNSFDTDVDVNDEEAFSKARKSFVEKFRGDDYFHYMTRLFRDNSFERVEKAVAEDIIFKCRRLEIAKKYLRGLGFERELKLLEDDN
jgi:T4 RnlA family RNA ligase